MALSEKYWVTKDGENKGPFSLEEIRDEVDRFSLSATDHACEVGATEWLSIGEILNPSSSEEVESEDFPEKVNEPKQTVLEGRSTGSLNLGLTILLGLLVIACVFVFLWPKKSREGIGIAEVVDADRVDASQIPDFVAIEEKATEWSALSVINTLVHRPDGSLFTGWTVARYQNSDQVSSLIRHEQGNSLHGFTWKPNGDRCDETTLFEGNGIIVTYHTNGDRESESIFRQGLRDGNCKTWFKGGKNKGEAQYQNGKLHGRLVSFHLSGQRTKEIFYLNGKQDGPYELLTEEGQKYDIGSYKHGERHGLRSQWSPEGTRLDDEIYENGELIVPVMVQKDPSGIESDISTLDDTGVHKPPLMFDTRDVGPDVKVVADTLSRSVIKVRERFSIENVSGYQRFEALAVASYEYMVSKGTQLEKESFVPLREAFVAFRNTWGMSADLVDEDGFALSVPPLSVSYGPMTLSRDEFGGLPVNHSMEDIDFILGETESLFNSVGLDLQLNDTFIRQEVSMSIWKKLWEQGGKAESANLLVQGNSLSFSVVEPYKKKSLDRNGNSVFTDEQREVELTFSTAAVDKPLGNYANVLLLAQARTEDFPSPQNPKLTIRKFFGIVVRSGAVLYPEVSVMIACASPLNEKSLIRGLKVELGKPLPEPVLK